MAKIPTNLSQLNLLIFPASSKLFSQHWNPSQSGTRPTKIVHSTTKASPTKFISRIVSTNWKNQSQHIYKPKEEFSRKKTHGVHPDTDALCRPLPSLLSNQMVVVSPGKVYQSPFPRWYNPNATCAYHDDVPWHSIEQCVAFKHKATHCYNE